MSKKKAHLMESLLELFLNSSTTTIVVVTTLLLTLSVTLFVVSILGLLGVL